MEPSKKETEVIAMTDWNDSLTKKKKASLSYRVILSFFVTGTPYNGDVGKSICATTTAVRYLQLCTASSAAA